MATDFQSFFSSHIAPAVHPQRDEYDLLFRTDLSINDIRLCFQMTGLSIVRLQIIASDHFPSLLERPVKDFVLIARKMLLAR